MSAFFSSNGTAAPTIAPSAQDTFNPTQLQDRVVIMLLFDQVVREADVRIAWEKRAPSRDAHQALWRVLATVDGVDSEVVYAEAARVYGFNSMRVNATHALKHMKSLRERTDLRHWLALLSEGVVPVDEKDERLVFATHDPTRPAVRRAIQQAWAAPYDLRYANRSSITALISTAAQRQEAYVRPTDRFAAPWASDAPAESRWTEGDSSSTDSLDRPTFMRLLEGALVGVVRREAEVVCLMPNASDETELFVEEEGRLQPWYTVHEVPAQVLLAALKSYILEVNGERTTPSNTRTIQRWIDGVRITFAMDWRAEPNRVPCACIRVVTV